MSIPDWLELIKDKFKDASAYTMTTQQVSMLEERIRLRDDNIELVKGKLAERQAQLDAAVIELAAKSKELAETVQQLEKYKGREKFDVISGVAFKRGKKKGQYEESPLCPNCHTHLSHSLCYALTDYHCPTCKHKMTKIDKPKELIEKLKSQRLQPPLSFDRRWRPCRE